MWEYLQQFNFFLLDIFQFIYHISWTYLFCIIIICFNLIMFLNASALVNKLTWFFFILMGCSSIIWLCSLETFGFILILTELALIFLFFIVATQFTLKILTPSVKLTTTVLFFFTVMCLLDFETNLNFNSISYYNALFLIITADYFFIYYFLVIYLDIVIYTALILGLFSLYFIFLYYKLKNFYNNSKSKTKTIYSVRKQNLIHQAIYQNYLRWFQ